MITHVLLMVLALFHSISLVAAAPSREQPEPSKHHHCRSILCDELHPVFQHFDPVERIRYGYGMTNNSQTAFYWYRKSAESGDSRAMHNVGIMLTLGLGTVRDAGSGAVWLQRAFKQGQMSSAIALGHMHRTGTGVQQNLRLASQYYQAAVDRGDVRAQHSLANLYMMGQSVIQSRVDAFVLYSLAARKGHLPSISARDLLAQMLSDEELQISRWMIRRQLR